MAIFFDPHLQFDPHFGPRNFSWAEPYLESPWVKAMGLLAPRFPAPGDSESSEVWRHFAAACAGGAAVLAGIGVIASFWVLLRSCCCFRRPPQVRPSSKPLICGGVLTLLLAVAGMAAYLLIGAKGISTAVTQADNAIADIRNATDQGKRLAVLGTQLSATLNATMPKCPQAVQQELTNLQIKIEGYRSTVAAYNFDVQDIPDELEDVHNALGSANHVSNFGLAAPLALVFLCCAAVMLVVFATRCRTSGRVGCCNCCIRSLGPLVFAPAILVVAGISAAEFGVGLAMASFCKDVDANTLTYVHHYAGEVAYNATRYYIEGVGSNPFLDQLAEANATLSAASQVLQQDGSLIAAACDDPAAVRNLTSVLAATTQPLNVWGELLRPEHIYPYYQAMVHEDACVTLVSGLGWLVLFQYFVGLVCLPALVCKAETFITQWGLWAPAPQWSTMPARRLLQGVETEMNV